MARLVATLALVLGTLPVPATACPPPVPTGPVALTKDGATLLGEGGILFGEGPIGRGNEDLIDVRSPTLRDAITGAEVAATWRQLGPGLTVLTPKTRRDRDLELLSPGGRVLLTVHQLRTQGVLGAPVIAKARATTRPRSPPSHVDVPASELSLELRDPPPPDAFALVVSDARGGWGRLWLTPTKGQTTFVVRAGGGKRCSGGMDPVYAGERIVVAWVDTYGRVSPTSRPVAVALARP